MAKKERPAAQSDGRNRVVIERMDPRIDCGRFPIKRVVGEPVTVEADVFADGHDAISGLLLHRHIRDEEWAESAIEHIGNDRWRGTFQVLKLGEYEYSIQAWIDHFKTWRRDLRKRLDAGQVEPADVQMGAELIDAASGRASGADKKALADWASSLATIPNRLEAANLALSAELAAIMDRYPDRSLATTAGERLRVVVERERARFSSWYEFFPRSCTPDASRHATLADCVSILPYVAGMGFDVFYLPPVHPVGRTHRKGKNNTLVPARKDPGSPWAIGADTGGHTALNPDLGTLEQFDQFVAEAAQSGLEVALDIAFQCSPDHPYVKEHPEWFQHRPDGAIQYAENPPKKYEDIYPFNFETSDWKALWEELRDVFLFWVDHGVRIFRVDNPHTKPFAFWEWVISEIRQRNPGVIFLSEAFTRPKVMYRLAKAGFSQSYTYFPWRNTSWELRQYHDVVTRGEIAEYFRPNSWPNTPDILPEYLQTGGRPAFMTRLVLAATLTANYGIYGPAFELVENVPREPGSEEYLDSEKYEIRARLADIEKPGSLKDFVALINRIRRENPALQSDRNLVFHNADNPELICYSKRTHDFSNVILVVVNLDPHHVQSGWLDVNPRELGTSSQADYQAHDLISGGRYLFHGRNNFVVLDPSKAPAHVFRIRRRVRTEQDFEYYL